MGRTSYLFILSNSLVCHCPYIALTHPRPWYNLKCKHDYFSGECHFWSCQSKDKKCFPYLKNIAFRTSTLTMQSVHKNTEENAYYPYFIDSMRMIFWVLKRFIVLKIYKNYWIILFQEIGCFAYRNEFCIGRLFGKIRM